MDAGLFRGYRGLTRIKPNVRILIRVLREIRGKVRSLLFRDSVKTSIILSEAKNQGMILFILDILPQRIAVLFGHPFRVLWLECLRRS